MEPTDARAAQECCDEIFHSLNKHYRDSPDMAISLLIYLVVRTSSSINADPQQIIEALTQAFQIQALIDLEIPSDFVN